jgi:hypothetical protein
MTLDQITIEDILERYSVLPDELLVILEDPNTEKIVETVCQKNNVSKPEWIDTIKQLVGYVLMGFIHYYDLGAEINTELNFPNSKLGNDIASEIEAKIFGSIKNILEKNYSPLPPKKELEVFEVQIPPIKEVIEDKKTQTVSKITEPVSLEKQGVLQKQPETPKPFFITETIKPQEQKTPPQPQTIPTQKETPLEQKIPTVLISKINIPPGVQAPIPPTPPTKISPPPPQPTPPTPKTTPIPTPQKPETAPIPPKPETTPKPAPPPIFLHKEETISPIKKGVEIKPQEIKISNIKPPPPPPKPAQIEIGGKEPPPPTKAPAFKIKNYYETGTNSQTAPPQPPKPPEKPPAPPTPPSPSTK